MDADHNSIKFLDMINKRPQTKATASLPLINTIMILPKPLQVVICRRVSLKGSPSQILEVGASHICDHKTSIQEFLLRTRILSHRKTVDLLFVI